MDAGDRDLDRDRLIVPFDVGLYDGVRWVNGYPDGRDRDYT